MRIVVTGGLGFIGHHLVNRLIEFGHEVVIVDSGASGDAARATQGVSLVHRDIRSLAIEEAEEIMHGCEWVFHLAAHKHQSESSDPDGMIDANVHATYRLMKAAATAGVKRFVFASSLYAYGSMGPNVMAESDVPVPTTLYGATKLFGESLVAGFNSREEIETSYGAARLFFIYGPGQYSEGGYRSVIGISMERILDGLPPIQYGDGEQSLDYVYVQDCVDALIALAENRECREPVNVCSGVPRKVKDLISSICRISNTQLPPIPAESDWTHGSTRFGSPTKAYEILGWQATTDLDTGLLAMWESTVSDRNG